MSLKDKTKISAETRRIVLERDSKDGCPCCIYCGRPFLHGGAQLHHVKRRSQGGPGTEANLVTLCWECHGAIDNGNKEIQMFCEDYLEGIYGTET